MSYRHALVRGVIVLVKAWIVLAAVLGLIMAVKGNYTAAGWQLIPLALYLVYRGVEALQVEENHA